MKPYICIACLITMLFASAQHAAADMIQFSDTANVSETNSGAGTGLTVINLTASVILPQFDPAQGTLAGVSWVDTITNDGDAAWTFTNNSTNFALVDYTLTNSGTRVIFPGIIGSTDAGSTSVDKNPQVPNNGGQLVDTLDGRLPNGSNTPLFIGSYIGTGDLTATFNQTSLLLVDAINAGGADPNLVTYTGTATVEWTRTITYQFTAIPEPASMLLLVPGLALIAARKRNLH